MTDLQNNPLPRQPWWRFRIVWLVIGLPLTAVLASTTSAVLAIRGADSVVSATAVAPEQRPAVEGRNHAATGGRR